MVKFLALSSEIFFRDSLGKEKIMGFGHRVYKVYDPRAKILKQYADYITQKNDRNLYETANAIATAEMMVIETSD